MWWDVWVSVNKTILQSFFLTVKLNFKSCTFHYKSCLLLAVKTWLHFYEPIKTAFVLKNAWGVTDERGFCESCLRTFCLVDGCAFRLSGYSGSFMSVSLISSFSNCLTLSQNHQTNTRKHIYDRQSLLEISSVYKHQLYHREDSTGASEPALPDCSTAFCPRLWEPWTQITRPSLKPHVNPLPPETWTTPPPNLTTSQEKKNVKRFCAIQSVLHTGEWACTNHL